MDLSGHQVLKSIDESLFQEYSFDYGTKTKFQELDVGSLRPIAELRAEAEKKRHQKETQRATAGSGSGGYKPYCPIPALELQKLNSFSSPPEQSSKRQLGRSSMKAIVKWVDPDLKLTLPEIGELKNYIDGLLGNLGSCIRRIYDDFRRIDSALTSHDDSKPSTERRDSPRESLPDIVTPRGSKEEEDEKINSEEESSSSRNGNKAKKTEFSFICTQPDKLIRPHNPLKNENHRLDGNFGSVSYGGRSYESREDFLKACKQAFIAHSAQTASNIELEKFSRDSKRVKKWKGAKLRPLKKKNVKKSRHHSSFAVWMEKVLALHQEERRLSELRHEALGSTISDGSFFTIPEEMEYCVATTEMQYKQHQQQLLRQAAPSQHQNSGSASFTMKFQPKPPGDQSQSSPFASGNSVATERNVSFHKLSSQRTSMDHPPKDVITESGDRVDDVPESLSCEDLALRASPTSASAANVGGNNCSGSPRARRHRTSVNVAMTYILSALPSASTNTAVQNSEALASHYIGNSPPSSLRSIHKASKGISPKKKAVKLIPMKNPPSLRSLVPKTEISLPRSQSLEEKMRSLLLNTDPLPPSFFGGISDASPLGGQSRGSERDPLGQPHGAETEEVHVKKVDFGHPAKGKAHCILDELDSILC